MKEATSASNDRNLWGASFFPRLPAPAQMLTESAEAARWLYFGMGPDPFEEVEGGAYVLQPPAGVPPLAVLHFVGGTFVGASPQITYRCFLQKLAARGMVVVATPFDAGFDNGRIADQVLFKFNEAMRQLGSSVASLPAYGVGHSLGAVIHLILGSRYAVQRNSNVLLSVNSQELKDSVPLFMPVVSPITQRFAPVLAELSRSPLSGTVGSTVGQLKNQGPPIVKQLLPLMEQLEPFARDVVKGQQTMVPNRHDIQRMVESYYHVPRNLLVRFTDDEVDETPDVSLWLQRAAEVDTILDLTILRRPGSHTRPLRQPLPELPEDVVNVASQGGDLLDMLASLAGPLGGSGTPLDDLRRSVDTLATPTASASSDVHADMSQLVDDIADWIAAGTNKLVRVSPSATATAPTADAADSSSTGIRAASAAATEGSSSARLPAPVRTTPSLPYRRPALQDGSGGAAPPPPPRPPPPGRDGTV